MVKDTHFRAQPQLHSNNVTETCDPENPVQLITQVQVAPNVTDDSVLLAEALPDLKARTGVETLITDGTYGSADNDRLLAEQQVTLIQTAIRGRPRDPERFYLDDFQVGTDGTGTPARVTCPVGVPATVTLSRSGQACVAVFGGDACTTCVERYRCPVVLRQRSGEWVLRFTVEELRRAVRRRQAAQHQQSGRNLRAAIESTIRSVKHPFAGGKLPVRGRFRAACMVIGSAAVVNVRRLHRFLHARFRLLQGKEGAGARRKQERLGQSVLLPLFSLIRAVQALCKSLVTIQPPHCVVFGW